MLRFGGGAYSWTGLYTCFGGKCFKSAFYSGKKRQWIHVNLNEYNNYVGTCCCFDEGHTENDRDDFAVFSTAILSGAIAGFGYFDCGSVGVYGDCTVWTTCLWGGYEDVCDDYCW